MRVFFIIFGRSYNQKRSKNNFSHVTPEVKQMVKDIGRKYGFNVVEPSYRNHRYNNPDAELGDIFPISGIYLESQVEDFFKKKSKERS